MEIGGILAIIGLALIVTAAWYHVKKDNSDLRKATEMVGKTTGKVESFDERLSISTGHYLSHKIRIEKIEQELKLMHQMIDTRPLKIFKKVVYAQDFNPKVMRKSK